MDGENSAVKYVDYTFILPGSNNSESLYLEISSLAE